jgi:UDP-glucose 4-epimerase
VKEAADAYMTLARALECDGIPGQAFNIGYEEPVSVIELVIEILQPNEREDLKPDIQNTAVGEIRAQYLPSEKVPTMLQWAPTYERKNSLQETIDWGCRYLQEPGT